MKKVFALLTVLSLLVFAGSAFAVTITASPASLAIMAGQSETSTVTGTAEKEGTLTYVMTSGPEWASFSGTTVTFSPAATVEAGSYSATVRVTETYTESDAGGHSTKTDTADVTINVLVVAIDPATFNLTASAPSVSLQPGGTGSSTITAASDLGEITYAKVDGPDWATLSGNTVNFAPGSDVTGTYNVVVRVTATEGLYSTTQDVTITVTIGGGSGEETSDPDPKPVVIEDVQEEDILDIYTLGDENTNEVDEEKAANMENDPTTSINNSDEYSDEEKKLAANTTANTENAVENAKGSGGLPNVPIIQKGLFKIKPKSMANAAEDTAKFNKERGNEESAPNTRFGVDATDLTQPFIIIVPGPRFSSELVGMFIYVFKIVENAATGGSNILSAGYEDAVFAAADVDNRDAVLFFDSNGNPTTTVPGPVDENGNQRIAGFVSMATYVEPGKEYDLIFSVPVRELEKQGVAVTSETRAVAKPVFYASGTSYFSTFVSADLIDGTDYYRISEDAIASKYNSVKVGSDWKRTDAELAHATENNYTMITRLAALDASAETRTRTYIVAVNFSSDRIAQIDKTSTGGFIFYPNGPAEAAADATVLKAVVTDGTFALAELTPSDILNGTRSGYITFEIPEGETFSKPMLAVRTVKPADDKKFTFSISKTSLTVKLGDTDTATITPVNASGDVVYHAYEGSTELTWITFNGNAVTFAPTRASATAKTYNVSIRGTDAADSTYTANITVTVTDDTTPPGPGPETQLSLSASSSTVNVVVGNTESITLTATGLQGTASYAVSADARAGVTLIGDSTAEETAVFTPTAAGTYPVVFTVTDSGRTSGNTATTTVTLTATSVRRPGSSGGGCSAGFSALALAVLGAFIARRKK